MKTIERRIIYILTGILLITNNSCRHTYVPPAAATNKNFLVITGFINSGANATTSIILSRTQNLNDSIYLVTEKSAAVTIESQSGLSYALAELQDGNYQGILNLDPAGLYRVRIVTSNSSTYLSAYVPVKTTPPIDSVSWKQENEITKVKDVTVYVSTHDPQNATRYYHWDYVETWKYHSALTTPWYKDDDNLVHAKDPYNPDSQRDSCWQTNQSTDIVIGTSLALSQDVISSQKVALIPQNDGRIAERYSILVRQYALTPEAYQFRLLLQKNTQEMGSLFDPQPSQLIGNITCLTNPAEPVIGFVSASTMEEKRIFISHDDVTDWNYEPHPACNTLQVDYGRDPMRYTYPDTTYGVYYFISMGPMVIAKKACLDCTIYGGTHVRPSYW